VTERVKRQVSDVQFQIFDLHVLRGWPVRDIAVTRDVSIAQVYLAKPRVGHTCWEIIRVTSRTFDASCRVKLLSGRVTMAVEDALTAQDKADGFILACQAKVQGEVRVDWCMGTMEKLIIACRISSTGSNVCCASQQSRDGGRMDLEDPGRIGC
jgi:hypothetical protein